MLRILLNMDNCLQTKTLVSKRSQNLPGVAHLTETHFVPVATIVTSAFERLQQDFPKNVQRGLLLNDSAHRDTGSMSL